MTAFQGHRVRRQRRRFLEKYQGRRRPCGPCHVVKSGVPNPTRRTSWKTNESGTSGGGWEGCSGKGGGRGFCERTSVSRYWSLVFEGRRREESKRLQRSLLAPVEICGVLSDEWLGWWRGNRQQSVRRSWSREVLFGQEGERRGRMGGNGRGKMDQECPWMRGWCGGTGTERERGRRGRRGVVGVYERERGRGRSD